MGFGFLHVTHKGCNCVGINDVSGTAFLHKCKISTLLELSPLQLVACNGMERRSEERSDMDFFSLPSIEARVRSDSLGSTGSCGKFVLRQRVAQLMTCMEDVSSDDDLHEELSRSIDQAFVICGKKIPPKMMDFRLQIVTWNVGTAPPPRDLSSLLQLDSSDANIDLYVIGLQEVNSRMVNFLSDLAFDDSWSLYFMDILAPLGYVKLSSIRMQGLLLLIFVKHKHIPFIQDIQTNYIRTGLYGYWGNKGGVTIRMSVYGHMLCFMNCHLPAHVEYINQRLDDFEKMLEAQQFGENIGSILDHDAVFWFGDLNFRIADFGIHFIREVINGNKYNLLWEKDQLNIAKKKERFLQGFMEGPLKFKPTYKFDINSDMKPLILAPSVTLRAEGEWNADHDSLISYSVSKDFPSSTWDWIGLYRAGLRHTNDYVTYAWVKDDEISFSKDCNQVYISADEIPMDGGEFLLGYYCHNLQCLAGISEPFQIQPGKTLLAKDGAEQTDDSTKSDMFMGAGF
ncbi:hypothetical protein GDO78_008771 [Eleutherodactylus coqui]|uniref:Inositol polyphosphate-related phosphatase domain-containing protein n=1 Tax=Eleutherodactylus coqui TaxID=57060 RepID=A0A8J6FEG3_ELECQ|nr:hypothetical protein GDO78_008771 [Eleutherodactylus coqui]